MINARLIAGYKIVNADGKRKKFKYGLVAFVGVRATYSKIYSELTGVSNKLEINPATYLPIIGLQNQFIWRRWKIILQGDFGALRNPDRYSIHISNFVYYRAGRLISLKFGWNHLILNTRGTFLKEEYKIKVTLSGPATGLVFHL